MIEVEDVFGKGEAEGDDDEEFNSVVDVFDFVVVNNADGAHFHQLFNDPDEHEGDDNAERQGDQAGKADEIVAVAFGKGEGVDRRKELPKEFID